MATYRDVGEVIVNGVDTIRWRIPEYTRLSKKVDDEWWSPFFTFRSQEGCCIDAYPNGLKRNKTEGWLGIGCVIPHLPERASLTCCMVDRDGKEIFHACLEGDQFYTQVKWIRRCKGVQVREIWHSRFNRDGPSIYRKYKWIRRSELDAQSQELLPGGQLHILIRVVLSNETERSAEEEKSGSEKDSKELSGISVCNSCMKFNKGVDRLTRNLKDMFVGNKDCDFIIRVKSREFHVHRFILKAMIPAFDAMLSHNMAENREGVVSLEDCDPEVFNEFLLFVYSGRVENLSPDNMCPLYILADKYDVQELKEMCLDFMKSSFSIEMFCEVIKLAAMHNEAELLKLAIDFFVNNAEEIMVTVKWQLFLAENPDQGNELLLKAMKFVKSKLPTV